MVLSSPQVVSDREGRRGSPGQTGLFRPHKTALLSFKDFYKIGIEVIVTVLYHVTAPLRAVDFHCAWQLQLHG